MYSEKLGKQTITLSFPTFDTLRPVLFIYKIKIFHIF